MAAGGQFARCVSHVCCECVRMCCGCAVGPSAPIRCRSAAAPLPLRSRSARAHGSMLPYQGGRRGGGMPHRERRSNFSDGAPGTYGLDLWMIIVCDVVFAILTLKDFMEYLLLLLQVIQFVSCGWAVCPDQVCTKLQ